MTTIDQMVDTILKHEGGFVNLKQDRGGATNFGVTIKEYGDYLGRPATVEDVRLMKKETAREIFKKKYYYAPKIDKLPTEIQPVIFDACVLYGPKRAIIFLQRVLNDHGATLVDDGVLGDKTVTLAFSTVTILGASTIIRAYVKKRIEFCEAIVRNNPSQKIFIKGWTNRANSFLPKKG